MGLVFADFQRHALRRRRRQRRRQRPKTYKPSPFGQSQINFKRGETLRCAKRAQSTPAERGGCVAVCVCWLWQVCAWQRGVPTNQSSPARERLRSLAAPAIRRSLRCEQRTLSVPLARLSYGPSAPNGTIVECWNRSLALSRLTRSSFGPLSGRKPVHRNSSPRRKNRTRIHTPM